MSLFRISPKTFVLGGLAIAAAAGALKNRDRVAGLIGARSSAPEPSRPEPRPAPEPSSAAAAEAPAPSNYDVDGPVANTATHVPAPDALVLDEDGGIDERAEEAAAAAEAAAIGGGMPEYAGLAMDEPADEAARPLMEAGEGESEGMEQAEADLVDEAEPRAGETSDAARRIDEVIAQADNPTTGESVEAVDTTAPDVPDRDDRIGAATADAADDGPRSASTDDDRAIRGVPAAESFGGASGVMPRPDLSAPAAAPEPPAPAPAPADAPTTETAAPGLPDERAVRAVESAAADESDADTPFIHPDQTSLLGDEEPARETPAAEKSSAVWQPPTAPQDPAQGEERREGDSGWQTWSGRPAE